MKRKITLGFFLFLAVGIFAQSAQNKNAVNKYEQQWKGVSKYEKDDLPKSALQVVEQILAQSVKEKNTPQTIKALIYKNRYNIAIDKEGNTQIFSDLEKLLSETSNVGDKALLHSMLAELYLNYFDANRWSSQRTAITGFVPEDIKEWPKNIFQDTALAHLSESMKPAETLTNVTTVSYEDIINLGSDSRRILPTLYDFLADRAIAQSARVTSDNERNNAFQQSLQAKKLQVKELAVQAEDFVKLDFSGDENLATLQFYKEFLQSLLNRKNNEAIVFTELKRNTYLSNRSETYRTKQAIAFLEELEKRNRAYDYNVEIISELANRLQSAYYGTDESDKENQKKRYEWLKYGIEKYPNYRRIDLLKNSLSRMEEPTAQLNGPTVYHPDNQSKKFTLTYKNLNEAALKVINKKTKAVVETKKLTLTPKTTYETETIEFTLDINKSGEYEIKTEFNKKNENSRENFSFAVSRLANFVRVSGENQYEFYVVDRLTGAPVSGATVTLYYSPKYNEYKELTSVKTDSKGIALLDAKSFFTNKNSYGYSYRVRLGDDLLPEYSRLPYSVYNSPPTYGEDVLSLFTDRSIYRPGQTIYFKAISTTQKDRNTTVLNVNKKYDVTLYDVNSQVVSEKTMTTNDFGSLAGEFVLPQGKLTGQFRIQIGNASQYFSVEEYKRPTFQVTFDKPDKAYTFGDEVKITGHVETFSGVKVQDANVAYTIKKSAYLRWWMPSMPETVDNDAVVTKSDGSFEILFTVPKNDARKNWFNTIYNFEIEATVTDLNGETQSGTFNFGVGDVSMMLTANLPQQLDKDSDTKIQVSAANLSGEPVEAKGTYTIYSLLPNDSLNAKVATGTFSTKEKTDLMNELKKLPSAKYQLSLNAKDDKGRDVVSKDDFILYSVKDERPPVETNEWLIQKQPKFGPGKDAEIVLGVTAENATILLDLLKGEKLLERQQIKLSNSNRTFVIPYEAKYEDDVTAVFTYVINEKSYIKQVQITKEEENKNLTLKMEVFRDKLRPGQHEEWRISVKDNAGNPALAELLASMYDSSLDKLRAPTTWQFNRYYKGINYPELFRAVSFDAVSGYFYFSSTTKNVPAIRWDAFNWFGFNFYGYNIMYKRVRGTNSLMAEEKEVKAQVDFAADYDASVSSVDMALTDKPASVSVVSDAASSLRSKSTTDEKSAPQIRSNFAETAFFYPQLRTNENGETIITFTVPESNTTWKFRALAFDKALNAGTLEALAVSRKELMVTPNMPRFLRQGDKASISTKISNLSDRALSGKARIEFFDPLTDEVIDLKVNKQVDFSIEKDASSSASWTFDVPRDIDMLGVRVIAENASFSDGEQHVLPVLPNRMMVTESMTMNINGPGAKDFVFEKLVHNNSTSLTNYRLTLEYAGNPAWYAVQALPTLSNPTNENAVNWFASYYVNTLGAFIMQQYPNVSNMLKAWKQQGGDKETLMSKLQKNEELKSALLEETPWVLDARDETEQMSRLSLLFDLNNTRSQTQQAIDKMKELQGSDGGWSWYKGMYSNRSVTQYVLYGFSQLINLNAVQYPSDVKKMQINALKYIDARILQDFEDLKKQNSEWKRITSISTNQLEYLFVRSNYRDIPIDVKTREAERFYTSVVEKNWTSLNLYERSLFVSVCLKNGEKELAEKIMKSVREYATTNEEMGMFWANNTSRVFMSQSAVAVHTFLMEAFREMNAPASEMDGMKQWLLKQKQTQVWESTHATIDAIYALLSNGSDWLASSGDSKITINKQIVEPEKKELGTGYFKETWNKNQISNAMGNVRIEKPDNGPAWGALYWQYYEELDKITSQKGELNIDKKLFIEKSTDKGKTLVEVTEKSPLKIGDKVTVRLTVRVDRDMEFVHLKDMRASCFEPIEILSGMRWQNMAYYYQSTKDASTNFYFDNLRKGTYVFEYPVYVNRTGEYSNGITTLQCLYAPEFVSHTAGIRVVVE